MASNNTSFSLKVGSIVRAPRVAEGEKPKGRAMVATLQDDQSVCLLWEPCIPKPLHADCKFLVAPTLPAKKASASASSSITQEEITLDLSRIQPLLDFETSTTTPPTGQTGTDTIQFWKDRGDQLLRLGDPSSAIPYYEMALNASNVISIGSSVICSIQGYPKVAEVDCVEDDTVDIVYVETGEEATIPQSDILIAVLEGDSEDHSQERILLNLARCLLQHAEIDSPHRSKYLKSAVLACTLVLSIASFHGESSSDGVATTSDTAQTALLLRVKAQMGISKWPHASADAKRLIQLGNSSQGHKLLENIEREKKQQAKRDKKLVKAISRLVQTATSESVSEPQSINETIISAESSTNLDHATNQAEYPTGTRLSTQPPLSLFSSPSIMILLALTAAYLIQKAIS
jgi:hypothetical protein